MAHWAPITAVDSLSDGSLYATGSYDGQVIFWNERNEELWSFSAPDLVNCVRFDHSARRLAAAAADCKVYVFDCERRRLCSILGPFRDDVNAISWHPDDRRLAVVCDTFDADVHLMNVDNGKEVLVLCGHQDCVCNVSFSPDGARLCTAGEDRTARIWDATTGFALQVLEHPNDPESIAWSADGRYIATGCNDGQVRLWDATSRTLLAVSRAANAAVRYVTFTSDGDGLLAGSYDAHLRLLALPSLEVKRVYEAPFQWERSSAISRDAVLVGSFGTRPVIFNHDGSICQGAGLTYGINSIHAHSGRIIVGRDDGAVLDVQSARVLYRHNSIVNVCKFSPDLRFAASGDYAGYLKVYDVASGRVIAEIRRAGGPVNAIAWSSDSARFASASYDGRITWWNADLQEVACKDAHHGPIKCLEWCPRTDILVAGSSDHSVSGHRFAETVFHARDEGLSLVNAVALAPTEGTFFTASRDAVVRQWDIESGAVLDHLPRAHFRSVKALAYDEPSRLLLSGSYDGQAVLWSKDDGRWSWTALRLHGMPGVPSVTFDKGTPLSAGWDGTVGRWSTQGRLLSQYRLKEFTSEA